LRNKGFLKIHPRPIPGLASTLLFGIGGLAMAVLKRKKKAA
jgi:hypothetical protein